MPLAHCSSWLYKPASLGLLLCILVMPPVWADNATEQLNVEVELTSGLSLSCGVLDFGVVVITPTGSDNKANDTHVTLLSGASPNCPLCQGAALGGGGGAAECTISGASSDVAIFGRILDGSEFQKVTINERTTGGHARLQRKTNPAGGYGGTIEVRLNEPNRASNTALWSETPAKPGRSQIGEFEIVPNTGSTRTHTFSIGGVLTIARGSPFNAEMAGAYTGNFTLEIDERDR